MPESGYSSSSSMLKLFMYFAFVYSMLENTETINWLALARPYGQAERALGHLAQALETTRLHPAWLWRELIRLAPELAQASGFRVDQDQLRLAILGLPIDREDHTAGLAAAKRIFLAAVPLFQESPATDSAARLWPDFWHRDASSGSEPLQAEGGESEGERARLKAMATELTGLAEDGRRPALINLLIALRQRATACRSQPADRSLPASLMRLALPLALHQAGLLPRAAPGLLGGRRLPLGMSQASGEPMPLTDWLSRGLAELGKEGKQSHRRLAELTRQHRAWHRALAAEGLRRRARAPQVLDLLTATPVLSLGLIARHAGCSHVAAGQIAERLVATGILIEQTSRSRHKLFVAGDLARAGRGKVDPTMPLALSEAMVPVDADGIAATLDGLLADLDRLNARTSDRLVEGAG